MSDHRDRSELVGTGPCTKELKGVPNDLVFPVDKVSSVDSVAPALLSSEARPAIVLTERRLDGRGELAWLRGR